jgi:SAM-dependent methyltransferase
MVDEGHIGGFIIENDPATYTPLLWEHICKKFNINSVIDVGCGMGYGIQEFSKHCEKAVGVDGSEYVQEESPHKDLILKFDFSKEKFKPKELYDLAWSSEFVEHVEEKYIENYFPIFEASKYVAITYADINQEGHYHVNCNSSEYWINLFERNGFTFDREVNLKLKNFAYQDALSHNPKYKDNHFYNRGLFFTNNTKSDQ